MQEHTVIGLIGFGNMGQAMAQGLLKSGSVGKGQICACARDQEKLERNCAALGVRPMRNASQVIAASDVVILAVKPYQLEDVLAPIREQLKESSSSPWQQACLSPAWRACWHRAAHICP